MQDIIPLIANNVEDPFFVLVFAQSCKLFYDAITEKLKSAKIGPYILKLQQYYLYLKARYVLSISNKMLCNIIAPMGWGKTLTAIYFLLEYSGVMKEKIISLTDQDKTKNVFIVVPYAVLKVWIEEFDKLKLIQSKPDKSRILIAHSMRLHHNNHAKTVQQQPNSWFTNHSIVITTPEKAQKLLNYHYYQQNSSRLPIDLAVFDEAHKKIITKIPQQLAYLGYKKTKILGLSAENDEVDDTGTTVNDTNFENTLPKIEFIYHSIESNCDSYHKKVYHISDVKTKAKEYKQKLKLCVKHKKKVVIFIDKGEIGTLVREWMIEIFPERKYFELVGSTKIINQFYKCEDRCVLYIRANNNEGLNILVEHMIIFKPEMMAVGRIKQTIGRIRRPNNPYKEVTCSFICEGDLGVLKTLYGASYSNDKWDLGYEDYPNEQFLLRTKVIFNLLNIAYLESNLIDVAVIFDTNRKPGRVNKVLKWWKENKTEDTMLTKDKVKSLY